MVCMAMASDSLADSWLKHGALKQVRDRYTSGGKKSYLMYASGKALVALAISASTWLASLQPNMGSLYIDQYLHDSGSMIRLALLHAFDILGPTCTTKDPSLASTPFTYSCCQDASASGEISVPRE